MTVLALLVGAALAAGATPEAGPPTAPAASASAADPGKPICRKGVNQTGSRMKQRPVCLTRKEWDERKRLDRELMGAIQKGSVSNTRKSGTPQ